jgi:dienelactone hydrolase
MSATQDFAYEHDGLRLKGQIARPSGRGLHPAVLVMHSALGIDRLVCRRADLAALGYVALATDMYGAGRQLTKEEAGNHFLGLVENPDLLRARLVATFTTVRDLDRSKAHASPRSGSASAVNVRWNWRAAALRCCRSSASMDSSGRRARPNAVA